MFGGNALGRMARTLIWPRGARQVRAQANVPSQAKQAKDSSRGILRETVPEPSCGPLCQTWGSILEALSRCVFLELCCGRRRQTCC